MRLGIWTARWQLAGPTAEADRMRAALPAYRDRIVSTHRGARMRTSNIRGAAHANRVTPGN